MTENQYYYEAVGRRKTATARVRLYPAGETPEIVVNGKPMPEYFTRMADQQRMIEPMQATETNNQFNVSVLVKGGGVHSRSASTLRICSLSSVRSELLTT